MMKKLAALLLAVTMLTTMAFASSPSGTSPSGGGSSGSSTSPAGEINVSVAYVEIKASSNIASLTQWTGTGKKEVDEYLKNTTGAKPVAAFELTGKPGAVTLEMPGLVAGNNYAVLHYKSDGKLEVLPASVSGGKLTFTVKSFSSFVVVAVPQGTVKAPNTGAFDASGLATVLALTTLVGAAVLRFKKVQ